jgi:hypothetical protein
MKSIYSLFIALLISGLGLAQNVTIGGAFPTGTPTSCTNTTLSIGGTNYCGNYTYAGTTVTISNDTVFLDINYTVGLICLPSIVSWTQTVSVGTLFPQTYHIYATTYLNAVLQDVLSTPTFTVTTSGCCPAVAQIGLNADPVCFGDTLIMQSLGGGAISQIWNVDGFLYSTDTMASQPANSNGPFDIELIVTDGTCSDTMTQTVNVQQLPVVNLGADTSICNGSVLTKTASGGASYVWSSGSVNNTGEIDSVGQLSVTVTDQYGCSSDDAIQLLSLIDLVDITPSPNAKYCPGDSVEITANTSTSGATFQWNTGAQTASTFISNPGNKVVTVSANGFCDAKDTIFVSVFNLEPLTITPGADSCSPRSVEVNTDYVTYLWAGGETTSNIQITENSTVLIDVIDSNGCSQLDSLMVEVLDQPDVFIGNDTLICEETALILAANSVGAYLWSTGQTTFSIAVIVEDEYWLEVTNSAGCVGSDTMNLAVKVCVGVDELGNETSFGIYPNPTQNILNVKSDQAGTYSVINMLGQTVIEAKLESGSDAISLEDLTPGAYFIRNQDQETIRFIKQ